jgi:hypothetical protein
MNKGKESRQSAYEHNAEIISKAQEICEHARRARADELGISKEELPRDEKEALIIAHPLPEYETRIIPPRGAEPDPKIPLHLQWTNGSREYDLYLHSRQPLSEEELDMLEQELYEEGVDDPNARWGAMDRGDGRVNIFSPKRVPRHEHVAEVVIRVLVEDGGNLAN